MNQENNNNSNYYNNSNQQPIKLQPNYQEQPQPITNNQPMNNIQNSYQQPQQNIFSNQTNQVNSIENNNILEKTVQPIKLQPNYQGQPPLITNNQPMNNKQAKKSKIWIIVCFSIIIVIGIIIGISFLLKSNPTVNKNNENSKDEQLSVPPADYISIKTIEDYEKLLNGTYDLSKNYILMNDLDLGDYCKNNVCQPIGTNTDEGFTGIFNGNNYTISNYYYNIDDEDNKIYGIGFFGEINEGVVKNLKMENSTIILSNYYRYNEPTIGLLSGTTNTALIENCNVSGTIKTNNNIDDSISSVGLLIGRLYLSREGLNKHITDRTIKNGYGDDHIIATIKNTSVSGTISLNNTNGVEYKEIEKIGGMIGETEAEYHDEYGYGSINSIENCQADVTINITGQDTNVRDVGGLVGYSDRDYIYQSSSHGNITVNTGYYIAGFIGRSDNSQIEQCYSTTNITGGSGSAGFISYFNQSLGIELKGVTNSYSTGKVTVTDKDYFPDKSYKKMCDCASFIYDVHDIVENSYSTGDIIYKNSNLNYGKPFVADSTTNLINNYYNADVLDYSKDIYKYTKLTTENMFKKASYTSFDFEKIWKIDESKSTPQLQWQK